MRDVPRLGANALPERMKAADPVRNRRLSGRLLVERRLTPGHRSHRLAPTPQWANTVSSSDQERAMPIKRTDLKTEAGVKLTLVEEVTPQGVIRNQHYRLTTLRPTQPRVLAIRAAAEDAFDLEVVASLMDPVVQRLIERR